MTQNEKNVLTEGLRKLSADIAELAALFDGNADSAEENRPGDTEPPANAAVKEPETVDTGQEAATEPELEEAATAGEAPEADSAPAEPVTIEEARAALSALSRLGHRPEAQALVVKHGVEKLTDIRDPGLYAVILKEAEALMKRIPAAEPGTGSA